MIEIASRTPKCIRMQTLGVCGGYLYTLFGRNTKYLCNMTCLKGDFNDNSGLMPQIFEGNINTKV